MNDRKIDLSYIKVFGCTVYGHIQVPNRDKFDPQVVKCLFQDIYPQKGYKCYNLITKQVIVPCNVRFDEGTPYFNKSLETSGNRDLIPDLFPLFASNVSFDYDASACYHEDLEVTIPIVIPKDNYPEPSSLIPYVDL